jgi:hypothetical protein
VKLADLTEHIDPDKLGICIFAEQECSIQRHHQNVIEENPSFLLTEGTCPEMVKHVKSLVHPTRLPVHNGRGTKFSLFGNKNKIASGTSHYGSHQWCRSFPGHVACWWGAQYSSRP